MIRKVAIWLVINVTLFSILQWLALPVAITCINAMPVRWNHAPPAR